LLRITLKHERNNGRLFFSPIGSRSNALFKLMKRNYLTTEELPYLYKLGFIVDFLGNKSDDLEESHPVISLSADIVYGKVKFKPIDKIGDALSILIKRGYVDVDELPLLDKMGFHFDKITGYIKQAAKEIAYNDIGFELTKEGELLNGRESK
jgi:hypothetical protein